VKIKFKAINHWIVSNIDVAITPCLYYRVDCIEGAKSVSIMITWVGYSIGFQFMWLQK